MYKIGVFDSGIGGFSILSELIHLIPEADFFYYSDDAHAPYGPKSDQYITDRAFKIVEELLKKEVHAIVVACNTATAASIDSLRNHYPDMIFVGVEPYLNAYKKEHLEKAKMVVLTTESTSKSERFKHLKEKLDPGDTITSFSLKNLAKIVEDYYYHRINEITLDQLLSIELAPLKGKKITHAILGCTHYPLVENKIASLLQVKTLRPCPFVAARVKELLEKKYPTINPQLSSQDKDSLKYSTSFQFISSRDHLWVTRERANFLAPFQKTTSS